MPTSQLTDITPETAANFFGDTKNNPIGITEAEAVRAARAAVEASLSTTDKPLEANGVNHYGLPKESPFPSEAVRYGEQPVTPETAKEAALMQAFSDLTRNAIAPSFEI